jgi:hypothetical protein
LSTALAVVCLLGPILAQAHMLLVRHARCAEHGELVHLDGADGDSIGTGATASSDVTTVSSSSPEEAKSHGHDHCAAASARKTQAPVNCPQLTLPAASSSAAAPLDPDAPSSAPVALYLLAPKNSPPA